ncbi:antitoxin VapB family protein [Candidatus Micrarchaeota archaeon]|nr:antitoxin VapB family protein [Candidatus Micrarchaeota archaeon]MBU1165469.1 antitoxin VapB family protein [Candidatus Micrarchaeota archaeon]MBU1887450.1 antitoxin VapB family protein [Candidatus Micrarchaeota archaeon]
MGSVNISITEDVYKMLKNLKRGDESFSEVILAIVKTKDISRCYGLLKDRSAQLDQIEAEAKKVRKGNWRQVNI